MKLVSIISASALALGLCGTTYAQNEQNPNTQNQQTPNTQNQQTQPAQPGQEGGAGGASQRDKNDRDYQAEVKKCDGSSDKQKCLDAAKKKFNQM